MLMNKQGFLAKAYGALGIEDVHDVFTYFILQ